MERLLDALTGKGSSEATRQSFRQRFADGSLDTAEVEIEVDEAPGDAVRNPGHGRAGVRPEVDDGQARRASSPRKRRKLKVPDAFARLTEEEADKRVDPDDINRVALADAEANGIVFLDEIDKIAVSDVRGGSISREGVQRDLLPLIEGTTVATKYGPLKTDHILFIASGAFHIAKPADLLPELQGRLPIRVELKALTQQDFVRILSATRASLTEQYQALLGTEGVTINFADDGIEALARIAAEVNEALENIGARRLQTVMEKLLEDVSFEAEDRRGETLVVDAAFVDQQLSGIAQQRRPQPLRALTASSGSATPDRGRTATRRWLHARQGAASAATQMLQVRIALCLAGRPVEGVAAAVAGMAMRMRAAVGIEREIGADRGPQPPIFLRAQAESRAPRNAGSATYSTCITRLPPASADQIVRGVMSHHVGVLR